MGPNVNLGPAPSLGRRLAGLASSLLKGWVISLLVFGLLTTLTVYAWTTSFTDSYTISWAEVGRRGYRDWLAWAFVAPLLFQLVARLPLFGGRWKLGIPVHLLFAMGVFAFCGWWGDTGASALWPATFGPFRENRRPGARRPPEQQQRATPLPDQGAGRPPEQGVPRLSEQLATRPPGEGSTPGPEPGSVRPPNASGPQRPQGWQQRSGRQPGGPGPRSRYFDPFVLTFRLPIYMALLSVAHALVFYRRFQARERRSLELESGLAKARLDALRMQLQPHFLFNSLNAIAALIHKDPEAADEMVAALSDFLRLTLESSSEQELPLGRELEFVTRYLAIEKVRFGDRLQFTIDTPIDTLPALVPTLVLQPLVENAVRHGLEPKILGGTLTISARHEGPRLVLKVVDDGAGLHASTPPRQGIGLVNTRSRLGELYGSAATLEMRNGNGVSVEITLPFHTVAGTA